MITVFFCNFKVYIVHLNIEIEIKTLESTVKNFKKINILWGEKTTWI